MRVYRASKNGGVEECGEDYFNAVSICNDVVACVIISPRRSPSLCKQAELMSPSGVEDKDRRPHDMSLSSPHILY